MLRALIVSAALALARLTASESAAAADVSWTNPAGGLWSNPANWSTGTVPGSSDQALIVLAGNYTVTLDVSPTVAGLTVGAGSGQQILTASARTLTSPSTVTIETSGLLDISGCTINAALDIRGQLTAHKSETINGALTTETGATVLVVGGAGSSATLTMNAAATNGGTFTLTSVTATLRANLAGSGTLTNAAGGLIQVLVGTGGERHVSMALDNQGTLTLGTPFYIDNAGKSYVNESGATINANDDLVITQSGASPSFNNQGTINVAVLHAVSVTAGTFANSGTFAGAGSLSLNSLSANLSTTLTLSLASVSVNSSTVSAPQGVINGAGTTLTITSSTLNGALENRGTLVTRQPTTVLNGTLTNQAGASWRVEGGPGGSAVVTLGGAATNHGTLDLTSVGGNAQAILGGAGPLINATDGSIRVLPGTGGERHLATPLDNQGTVTTTYPLYVDNSAGSYVNEASGTIQANDDIVVTQTGASPSFSNQGTINLAAAHTISVSGGTFSNSGTVAGGTLALTSLAVNASLGMVNPAGTTLVLFATTLSGSLENRGLLVAHQANTVNGTLTNQAGATLRAEGNPGATGQLTLNGAATNHGTIDLTSVTAALQSHLLGTGPLTNAVDGLIRVLPGSGGERHLKVPLDNQGTVTITYPLYIDNGAGSYLNESGGTFQASDDIVITQTGVSSSFTNQGTINVAAGHTVNVTGKTFGNSGTMTGAGSLSLANLTANLSTAAGLTLGTVSITTSTVNASLGLVNGAGSTLVIAASTVNGSIQNQGTLIAHQSTSTITGTMTNQAGATWRVEGAPPSSASLILGGAAINHGTLDLTAAIANFQAILGGSGGLTNASDGLIEVLSGTGGERRLQTTLVNQGMMTIQYPLYIDNVGLDHLNDVSGTIVLNQDIVLSQSGVTPSFANRGTLTVNAGHTFTINGGAFLNDVGGTLRGAGTVAISGTDLVNAGLISPGTSPGKLSVTGRIVQNPTGRVRVELSGTQAVTQYDLLSDNGQMVLGGTLEVALLQGFVPPAGSAYIPIKWTAHTGTFASYQGLDLGGNLQFVPTYTDTGLILSTGPLAIVNVTANRGGNNGVVSVVVHGVGLFAGLSTWLARGAQQIPGTVLDLSPDGSAFSVKFDLTGAALGAWDLVVRSTDGTTITLPAGFTVEAGRTPQIMVQIVGRSSIRVGQPSTFNIVFYNTGNTDALGVQIGIGGLPAGVPSTIGPPLMNPPPVPGAGNPDYSNAPISYASGGDSTVILEFPRVPPEIPQYVSVTVTPPNTNSIDLKTYSNSPYSVLLTEPEPLDCVAGIMSTVFECSGLARHEECAGEIASLYFSTAISSAQTFNDLRFAPADVDASTGCSLLRYYGETILALTAACAGEIPILSIFDKVQCGIGVIETLDACQQCFTHESFAEMLVGVFVAHDPNEKAGPIGVGAQRFIRGKDPMPYGIYFENAASATAPAAVVVVADTLDTTKVDVSTVALGPIRFGSHVLTPPPGSSSFLGTIDLRPSQNLVVKVDVRRDLAAGVLTWQLSSIDPDTGAPPADPTAGFLPPNIAAPQGEGNVQYTVMPRSNVTTGQVIANRASIVFDANAPILTPVWANTVDGTAPVSAVAALPAETNTLTFPVSWGGSDVGSGVRDFTIHVSVDAGPDSVWLTNVSSTSATFSGQAGHTYSFYSVARDSAFNQEAAPAQPDAQTTIPGTVGVTVPRPFVFALRGAWPNPADARVQVFFELPSWTKAELELFDVSGRRVARRDVGSLGPGPHSVSLGESVRIQSGLYFVRLHQGRNTSIKKITISR